MRQRKWQGEWDNYVPVSVWSRLPLSSGDLNSPSPQSGDWAPLRLDSGKNDALTEYQNHHAPHVPLANMSQPFKSASFVNIWRGMCECSRGYYWQVPQTLKETAVSHRWRRCGFTTAWHTYILFGHWWGPADIWSLCGHVSFKLVICLYVQWNSFCSQ